MKKYLYSSLILGLTPVSCGIAIEQQDNFKALWFVELPFILALSLELFAYYFIGIILSYAFLVYVKDEFKSDFLIRKSSRIYLIIWLILCFSYPLLIEITKTN